MKLKREWKEMNGVLAMIFSTKLLMLLVSLYFSDALATVLKWIFGKGARGAYEVFADGGSLSSTLTDIFIYILCVFVPFAVYMFFSRKDSAEVILSKRPEPMQICFGVGASVIIGQVASIVGNILIDRLFRLFGNDGYLDKMTAETSTNYPNNFWVILLFVIMMSVLPAFFEEFLVRGALVSSTQKYGTLFTLFASGFFFAFLHNTWVQLPLAFTIGVVSAYFTLRFKSIWIAVIAHFVFNFNSTVNGLLLSLGEEEGLAAFSVWAMIFYPLMLGFLIAGWIIYGFKKPDIPESTYKNTEKWKLLLTSPFFYAFLILTVYRLILA